jgi:hypothetical protein
MVGKRKEERKKWKLPTIIDLDQVRLQERKVQVQVRENIVSEKDK